MLDSLRQSVGNWLDDRDFNYPLERHGRGGLIYRLLHPITERIYHERHPLANRRIDLIGLVDDESQADLAVVEQRLQELRDMDAKAGHDRRALRDQLGAEQRAERNSAAPVEGESSYARFRREQDSGVGGPERES